MRKRVTYRAQTKPTKLSLPNQTYQAKPTKPNLPNQHKRINMCYDLKAVTFVKILNPWVSCAFGNILDNCSLTRCNQAAERVSSAAQRLITLHPADGAMLYFLNIFGIYLLFSFIIIFRYTVPTCATPYFLYIFLLSFNFYLLNVIPCQQCNVLQSCNIL